METSPLALPNRPAAPGPVPTSASAVAGLSKMFGDDGLSFGDVLDLINPLQHIPVVGNLYRKITGDVVAPAIRVAGGALFGGPIGAALSFGGLLLERARGNSPAPPAESAPDTALAGAQSTQTYRGGWIVNAARTGNLPAPPSPDNPAAETEVAQWPLATNRRGGWLVNQAYGIAAPSAGTAPRIVDQA